MSDDNDKLVQELVNQMADINLKLIVLRNYYGGKTDYICSAIEKLASINEGFRFHFKESNKEEKQ